MIELRAILEGRAKTLWFTASVIATYVLTSITLCGLYAQFLHEFQNAAPFVLSLFVFAQKVFDVLWVTRRQQALFQDVFLAQ